MEQLERDFHDANSSFDELSELDELELDEEPEGPDIYHREESFYRSLEDY